MRKAILKKIMMKFNKILDISEWLHTFGPCAKDYYQGFMSLFLRDGILFETYLFDEKEIDFHKNILLPTIIEIEKKTGAKPLIVALEPTRNEGGKFWNSYPPSTLDYIKKKLDK